MLLCIRVINVARFASIHTHLWSCVPAAARIETTIDELLRRIQCDSDKKREHFASDSLFGLHGVSIIGTPSAIFLEESFTRQV